jgi:hypothetical protein
MMTKSETLSAFDSGYTQALMSLDTFIRTKNMNTHPAISAVRLEIVAMLNDLSGILKEDIEEARDDYR